MNTEQEILIKKFVTKTLTNEEIPVFKDFYKHNSEFKSETDITLEMIIALNAAHKLNAGNQKKKLKLRIYTWVAAAASIVLLISIWFLFSQKTAMDNQKLFTQFYKMPSGIEKKLGVESIEKSIFHAFETYEKKLFAQAFTEFSAIPDSAMDMRLFKAICLMEIKKENEAIIVFDSLIKENHINRNDAEWYKGLTYLKTGKIIQAKEIFTGISKSSSQYKMMAKKILDEMDE